MSELPCPQELIAATMGLMGAHAAGGGCADCQRQIAQAIVARLALLQQHPLLPPPFRACMAQAHRHWCGLLQAPPAAEAQTPAWLH